MQIDDCGLALYQVSMRPNFGEDALTLLYAHTLMLVPQMSLEM